MIEILAALLESELIVASWGISDIKISSDSVSFSVDGMKYQGLVSISQTSSSDCIVSLKGKASFRCSQLELASKLDNLIERSDNYYGDLLEWLNGKELKNNQSLPHEGDSVSSRAV